MLQNNLDPDVAERPDDLVVYGGTGRAARSWGAYHAMIRALTGLAGDETLLVQSGKPVGVLRTHEWAPRVLIANSNLVPEWGTWDEFRRLEHLGLTMFGQMTAGSWIYIGTQGILQGTYECFAAIARKRFDGSLAGTLTVTAGLGGMGGAQPLAVTMNEGVALCIEVDPVRAARRVETRYLDVVADDYGDALRRCEEARAARRPLSVGLVGNAADIVPRLLADGVAADIVTDQTSAHDPLTYVPNDLSPEAADELRRSQPAEFVRRSRAAMAAHVEAMVGSPRRRVRGLRLRQQPAGRSRARRLRASLRLPGFPARLHPAAVLRRQGAVPLGGPVGRSGRHRSHRPGRARGIPRGREPQALDHAGRRAGRLPRPAGPDLLAGATANATGWGCGSTRWSAPGSCLRPSSSDATTSTRARWPPPIARPRTCSTAATPIADWPLLNALANTSSGASWVSIHHGGGVGVGRSIHAGQVSVADGTDLAAQKLERVLLNDPATGVMRHADAGYDRAWEVAADRGVRIPADRPARTSADR